MALVQPVMGVHQICLLNVMLTVAEVEGSAHCLAFLVAQNMLCFCSTSKMCPM